MPDQVQGADNGLATVDGPRRRKSYASILWRAQRDEIIVEGRTSDPVELQQWSMHSCTAMFCEARVNVVTGEARVSRFLESFDCGRIIASRPPPASSKSASSWASAWR